MIDIENSIFSLVYTAVTTSFPTAYVAGIFETTPPQFPAVMIEQKNNPATRSTQTSSNMEYSVDPMFEVNVFSNKLGAKKAECKEIVSVVDAVLCGLGFTRTMLEPIPNQADPSIYRMTGRYTARVDENETIYRS